MESASVIRPFNYAAVSTRSHVKTVFEKPGMFTMNNAAFSSHSKLHIRGGNIISIKSRRESPLVSCVKTSDSALTAKSSGDPNGAVLSESHRGIQEKKTSTNATFPRGFEALLTEVCDETKIAELKLKMGAFEIHMKRGIDGPAIPAPVFYQAPAPPAPPAAPAPPAPSNLENEPTLDAAPHPKVSPFTNTSAVKEAKLAALEASGLTGYSIVSSDTVGTFLRGRIRKGEVLPPVCSEGRMIKKGQVIGFVEQFGSISPVRSTVAGEVLKVLYAHGEALGYGDPILAVLPSFPGIGVQ